MSLTTQEPIKSLGEIRFGKSTSFKYSVTNEGSNPLEITKIVVGCGSCTKASTTKTKLLPGETSEIDVQFTPGSIGSQKKYITVKYDDIQVLSLQFTADVHK